MESDSFGTEAMGPLGEFQPADGPTTEEAAECVRDMQNELQASDERIWQLEQQVKRLEKAQEDHGNELTHAYADGRDDEHQEMQAKLDIALDMLAEWCVAIEVNGTGWDDWDEYYKDAAYRDGPLRAELDKAIAEAKMRRAPSSDDDLHF